jgi:hypothetical protein
MSIEAKQDSMIFYGDLGAFSFWSDKNVIRPKNIY